MSARRATPMYLVEDLDDARMHYLSLGFVPRPSDDEGCVGMIAGSTGVILLSRDYAERSMPARAVALLAEKPALYVWVESLEDARAGMRGTLLGEMQTTGLREWMIEAAQGLVVLAETGQSRAALH